MYYTRKELLSLKFKFLGINVKIDKSCIVLNPELTHLDNNSRIDAFCLISGLVTLGKYVHIAPYCLINGGKSGVFMSDFSTCAYGVYIFTSTDDYSGKSLTSGTVPKEFKNVIDSKVLIEKHCIIGTKSIIFPGVTLSEGCSVGAMSLVNKTTIPWMIYVGIPAKPLKERSKDLLNVEQKFLENHL